MDLDPPAPNPDPDGSDSITDPLPVVDGGDSCTDITYSAIYAVNEIQYIDYVVGQGDLQIDYPRFTKAQNSCG